jgi:hypothetical protein
MSKTNDHRSKGITILRDKDYFSYKEYSPKYVYEYKGITVSFKLDYDLHIGNFYSDTAISREALLKVIQKLSSLTFTSQALLFFSEYDSEMTGLLADYKIENESFENGRLNLVDGFENEHLIFSFEDFDSF